MQAIFFGEIYKISKYVAIADTTPSWFCTVLNSPEYQADAGTGNNCDIAYTISQALGQRGIFQERELELSVLRKGREALRTQLSSVLQIQLDTQVWSSMKNFSLFISRLFTGTSN